MTEAEAKTKWCPMVRITHLGGDRFHVGSGRSVTMTDSGGTNISDNCIGSACMSWRYGASTAECIPIEDCTPHGYCGLAGRP